MDARLVGHLARHWNITDFLAFSCVDRKTRQVCIENRKTLLDILRGRLLQNQEFDFDGINFPFFLYERDDNIIFRIFMHDFSNENYSHVIYKLLKALERDFANRCQVLFSKVPPSYTRQLCSAVPIYFYDLPIDKTAVHWDDLDYYLRRADHPSERRTVYRQFEIFGEIRGLKVKLVENYNQEDPKTQCTSLVMPSPIVESMEKAAQELEEELVDQEGRKKKRRRKRKIDKAK